MMIMPIWSQSIVILLIVWVTSRMIKRNAPLLQRYFIPSSLIGGALLLLIGYQALQIIPKDLSLWLGTLPALLINVVFAGMFIGHQRPTVKKVWQQAGPMIAFGSTMAWGMYVIGIGLTLLVLAPLFGAPNLFGALLEISFSGGHGTAAGLAPTFEKFGHPEITNIALGLATLSIVTAVVSGITILNIYNRRFGRILDRAGMELQQRRMIRRGYDLTRFTRKLEANPREILVSITLIALAIGIGWLLLKGLVLAEAWLLAPYTDIRVFAYLPLFPLVMFGGLILQMLLEVSHLSHLVQRNTIQTLGAIALDLLIITAIGTMSLSAIGHDFAPFIILAVAGVVWTLGAFFVLAPRFFHKHWFEYGMTDLGQAMGMTATGLLLNRLVDPLNRTGARESFAYKQLAYEPFMGGGIVTAFAVVAIAEFGPLPVLLVCTIACAFWIIVGLRLGKRRKAHHHHSDILARFAIARHDD
ncbi:MAG: sodium/glutamate symporter [Candidatus Saccharimonas sp.]